MSSLTLTQFTAEVALACRNMPTSDPYYSQITTYLNRARNKIIRAAIGPRTNVGLFPELNSSWTVGPTTVGSNIIPKPGDCIAVTAVHCARNNTAAVAVVPPTWGVSSEYELGFEPITDLGVLSKDATAVTGYPISYSRKGKSVIIYPTPTTGYTDYLRIYGVKSEVGLVNGSDTFFSDEQWDDVTVLKAAAMIMARRGWAARAVALEQAVLDELGRTANVEALEENSRDSVMITNAGLSRSDVYGR